MSVIRHLDAFRMSLTMEAKLVPPEYLPKISPEQMTTLEDYFRTNRNATSIDLDILAMELNLHEDDVRVWWAHRLAIWRKQQGLPANCGHIND